MRNGISVRMRQSQMIWWATSHHDPSTGTGFTTTHVLGPPCRRYLVRQVLGPPSPFNRYWVYHNPRIESTVPPVLGPPRPRYWVLHHPSTGTGLTTTPGLSPLRPFDQYWLYHNPGTGSTTLRPVLGPPRPFDRHRVRDDHRLRTSLVALVLTWHAVFFPGEEQRQTTAS